MGNPIMRDSTLRSHYDSVERVITTMKQQIDQPMSLQSMAKVACASPFHFNRTFRQVTGVPPSQFLYALRLDAARRLFMETDHKVIDVCYEVGYNSVGTFTRRFTDLLGVSPTLFRELLRLPLLHLPEYPDPATRFNGHLASSYRLSGQNWLSRSQRDNEFIPPAAFSPGSANSDCLESAPGRILQPQAQDSAFGLDSSASCRTCSGLNGAQT